MPISDYAHWNEEADRIWWEEEGRHPTRIGYDDDPEDSMNAADAFSEEIAEWDTERLHATLADEDYMARWPQTRPLIEWELKHRG